MTVRRLIAASSLALGLALVSGQADAQVPLARVEAAVEAVTPRVVDWRRDLHANPELGFAETRTAGVVADHLRSLGLEVRTGVGRTGVVGGVAAGTSGGREAARRGRVGMGRAQSVGGRDSGVLPVGGDPGPAGRARPLSLRRPTVTPGAPLRLDPLAQRSGHL